MPYVEGHLLPSCWCQAWSCDSLWVFGVRGSDAIQVWWKVLANSLKAMASLCSPSSLPPQVPCVLVLQPGCWVKKLQGVTAIPWHVHEKLLRLGGYLELGEGDWYGLIMNWFSQVQHSSAKGQAVASPSGEQHCQVLPGEDALWILLMVLGSAGKSSWTLGAGKG